MDTAQVFQTCALITPVVVGSAIGVVANREPKQVILGLIASPFVSTVGTTICLVLLSAFGVLGTVIYDAPQLHGILGLIPTAFVVGVVPSCLGFGAGYVIAGRLRGMRRHSRHPPS